MKKNNCKMTFMLKRAWKSKVLRVMRATVFVIIVSVTHILAVNTYSQNTPLTLNLKNTSVKDILGHIQENSEFFFIYDASVIDVQKEISIKAENKLIPEILDEIFRGSNVVYKIDDRQIALTKVNLPDTEIQQTKTVSGKVTDSSGQLLPGVTVVVKGTTQGTVTNADGEYSLTNIPEDATLVFSFVGMKTQEVVIGEQTNIDVVLEEDVIGIEEVVAIGYGMMKKSDLTGSISSVSEDEIKLIPTNDIRRALQGRAAGVDINYGSRRPGEGASILIRGHRSFSASNDPLYVIDGIPTTTNIGDINPADIESIEILKDASATAIYGSRAANGVVLIQTKRGKAGKTTINYSGYYGITKAVKMLDLMNGAEYAEVRREAYRNANQQYYKSNYPDPLYDYFDPGGIFRFDPGSWESVRMGYEWEDNEMITVKRDANGVPIYHPEMVRSTDWPSLFIRDGSAQQHQLSISGGSEKTKIMFATTYYKELGIVLDQDYNRYNFRLNIDHQINKWAKLGVSTSFASSVQNYGSDIYSYSFLSPLSVPYDENGNLVMYPGSDTINPLFDLDGIVDERTRNRFFSAIYFELTPFKGLNYRLNISPDLSSHRNGVFQASLSSVRKGGTNSATYSTEKNVSYVLENILTYNKSFKEKHDLTVTLVQSIQSEKKESSNIAASDLPYDYQKWYNIGTATTINGIGSRLTEMQLASIMGRVHYSFNKKYLLTFTGRQDGASMLAEGKKYDFFPAAALAWRLGEEKFIKDIPTISNLKLRVGYGVAGNSAINPYQTQGNLVRTAQDFGDATAYGYRPGSIPNPGLKWEKTATGNVAFDFGLFKNSITGSIDFYRSNTSDLLMDMQLPTVTGFNSVTMNVGSTRNTGIEAQLSAQILNKPNGFRWSADFLWFKNKEEIVELYGGKNDDIGNQWFIGQPINVSYDYVYDGIWQDTPEDLAKIEVFNTNGNRFDVGKIKLVDINNDDVINAEDRTILGTSVPNWIGSWANTLSYKGLELTVLLYTRQGQMEYAKSMRKTSLSGRENNIDVHYWTPNDPERYKAKYPRPSADQESPEYINTLGYVDVSFVKLRNITLSYTIPHSLVSKIKMQKLRFYINAQNPITWTKFKGLDPEGNYGYDTPSTKMFSIGVDVTI